jgi:hypothetical protein
MRNQPVKLKLHGALAENDRPLAGQARNTLLQPLFDSG